MVVFNACGTRGHWQKAATIGCTTHRTLKDATKISGPKSNGHLHEKRQTQWCGEKLTKMVRTVPRLPALFATRNTFVSWYGFLWAPSRP